MTAIRSASFSLSSHILTVAIHLGSLAVLGRLLSPVDFGLFGIIQATEALFHPLLDTGLGSAYIKLNKATKEASDAFFTVNVLLGFLVTVILCASAPVLVIIYGKKILLQLTLVFALSIIFRSLGSQPIAMLARSKRFDKIMLVNQISLVAGVATCVSAALAGWGVWALIVRATVQAATRSGSAYFLSSHHYSFTTFEEIKKYKGSLKFGIQIVFGRLLVGIYQSADKLFFGKFFSIDLLGHYSRACDLSKMPDTHIRTPLSSPAIAHLARIRNSETKKNAYLTMIHVILFLAGVPCMVCVLIGDKILPWFMGEQWGVAGDYFRILAIWGLAQIIQGICFVISINEVQTKNWIKINLLGILVVYLLPVGFTLSNPQPLKFILLLSISYFIYFFAIMLIYIYRYTTSLQAVVNAVRHIGVSSVVTVITFFCTPYIWDTLCRLGLNRFLSMLTFSGTFMCILALVQLLFNRKLFVDLYCFLFDRQKRVSG